MEYVKFLGKKEKGETLKVLLSEDNYTLSIVGLENINDSPQLKLGNYCIEEIDKRNEEVTIKFTKTAYWYLIIKSADKKLFKNYKELVIIISKN